MRAKAALPLPRAVEGEGREPAAEEDLLPVEELLLRRVEPRQEEDEGAVAATARPAQVADEHLPLEGDLDPLCSRIEVPMSRVDAAHGALGRLAVALEVDEP